MDIFNPQLVDRDPAAPLGSFFDIGTERFVYIRARGDVRRHMPVAISPDGMACETTSLARNMGVAGYDVPNALHGWVLVRGNTRVDPAAKRKLDAEARRLAGH